jgi:hypothetical protein
MYRCYYETTLQVAKFIESDSGRMPRGKVFLKEDNNKASIPNAQEAALLVGTAFVVLSVQTLHRL